MKNNVLVCRNWISAVAACLLLVMAISESRGVLAASPEANPQESK